MDFYIRGNNFYQGDKKVFLNSGEIHYFRIDRRLWDKHLDEAVNAGLTAISTYIPWAWHEEKESIFDFDGHSTPGKDLKGWFKLCNERGLMCIVKPGPFILAEFRGAGLPDWLLSEGGDNIRMQNRKGERVMSDGVNLFNPRYLEKVAIWYDNVMPVIRDHELIQGGPVSMMQICNEIGVFSWLAHQADYGEGVRERYIEYLRSRYNNISEINRLWGTDYQGFDMVELPPDANEPYRSRYDRGRDMEWHSFWRSYYGDYLRLMASMARERGVTIPMYHNLPGWIYGRGYEFPVNITMYEDLFRERSDIFFGLDHIPEFVSYRNMHDDRIINDITKSMQGRGPLFAAEFQSGSREYQVVTSPREMELFYKGSIANGLSGWNYYMFSAGNNQERRGYSGDRFYWFTPLSPGGERSSSFSLIEKMSNIVRVSEEIITESHRRAEICVLFYPPYYATEIERPAGETTDLSFLASAIRRPAYFDGLLKLLLVMNVDFDIIDISKGDELHPGRYRQAWVFATDEMDAGPQQKIVDYINKGGEAVVFPFLPDREMSQRSCTILRDAIGISPGGQEVIDSPLIDIMGFRDIKCNNPVITFPESGLSAEVIATTLNGIPCGFSKSVGNGSIVFLGTWTGFDTEGHKPVYDALLKRSGAVLRQVSSDSDFLTVRELFTETGKGLLFVSNYYNEARTGNIAYTHPASGELISFPLKAEGITIPSLYGILSPLCLPVTGSLSILHSTSDILGFEMVSGKLVMKISGDRDLIGEMVFEGDLSDDIIGAVIDSGEVKVVKTGERVALYYNHINGRPVSLEIYFQ